MVRWVVRPKSILTTPLKLKEILGARRTVAHPNRKRLYSWEKDFFLTYPPIEQLEEYHASRQTELDVSQHRRLLDKYRPLRAFASATKPTQRSLLSEYGLPVPWTEWSGGATQGEAAGTGDVQPDRAEGANDRYVVRPLRHSGGQGYRITGDRTDYNPEEEYIQRLYPKDYEYRIVYFKGQLLTTLLKRVPPSIDRNGPWNHAQGASFVTVSNPDNNRLRHTDVYEKLNIVPLVRTAHLLGVDVLLGPQLSPESPRRDYVISEFNFCPSISIDTTIERIRDYAHPRIE